MTSQLLPASRCCGLLLSGSLLLTACGSSEPAQVPEQASGAAPGQLNTEAVTAGSGLSAEYFDRPNFTNSRAKRTEQTINFDWGTGSPDPSIAPNTYSARYTGGLSAPASGSYTFYVTADDGVRLDLNGQSVVDDFADHAARTATGTLSLKAGQPVPLKLEYYENTGLASLKLEWSGPNLARQVIPASVLSTEAAPNAGVTYQGPIVIEKGGTYTGNWESLDPDVPAVTVKTGEPVIIEYSTIRGRGRLINVPWNNSDVTVRHTRGEGLNPGVRGRAQGRFIQTYNSNSLIVEHNDVQGTLGIHVNTYRGARNGVQTVRVNYNRFHNMLGQMSDGQGGYLASNTPGVPMEFPNMVQLYDVKNVPGIEIAWNEVISEPRKSRVEDVINFCRSGGTDQSRAEVHDNYIQGGHAYDPADRNFTGAGINAGDCGDGTLFGYVRVYGNQVVGFASGGIGINAGHDTEVFGNRVVSAGQLADGTHYPALGLAVWDYDKQGKALFFNNRSHDNVVGVMRRDGPDAYRCDGWWPEESKTPDGGDVWCKSGWFGNVSLPDPVTVDTEQAEFARWQQKLAANQVVIGPER